MVEKMNRRFGPGIGHQVWGPSILLNIPSHPRVGFLSAKCDRAGKIIIDGFGKFAKIDNLSIIEIMKLVQTSQERES